MEEISSLKKKLSSAALETKHLQGVRFIESDRFLWDHIERVIAYDPIAPHAPHYLLHEFGHALLDHREYKRDIELIKMERDAWTTASRLARKLDQTIPTELIEDALDSYRDWMHARSTCVRCEATGIQTSSETYECPACGTSWRVNNARSCALRRYTTKNAL